MHKAKISNTFYFTVVLSFVLSCTSLDRVFKGGTGAKKKQPQHQHQPQLLTAVVPWEVEQPELDVTEPGPAEDKPHPAKRSKRDHPSSPTMKTSEESPLEGSINGNSAMAGYFQFQPATPTCSMEY